MHSRIPRLSVKFTHWVLAGEREKPVSKPIEKVDLLSPLTGVQVSK
jgi:hypothetical protein